MSYWRKSVGTSLAIFVFIAIFIFMGVVNMQIVMGKDADLVNEILLEREQTENS